MSSGDPNMNSEAENPVVSEVGVSVEVDKAEAGKSGETGAVDKKKDGSDSDSDSDDEAATNKVSDAADGAGCCMQCTGDCLEDINGEAAHSMSCCGNLLEMFGTIMEVIAAPVAGPCCMWWFHKFVIVFAMLFFIVNVAIAFDDMANSTVTEIKLVHETIIFYPDIYICIPAFAYFHSFVCCGDTCGPGIDSGCYNFGNLALPLQGNSSGCDMGVFSNFDMGKTAASECPFMTYRGRGSLVDGVGTNGAPGWADMPTYVLEYGGANPEFKANDNYKNYIHAFATGLENKLPTYTPSDSYQVTIPAGTNKLVVGQTVVGSGTNKNTGTVSGVNAAGTKIILSNVSCNGAAACSDAIIIPQTMTTTSGTIFTTGAITAVSAARGYKFRQTTFKPTCFYYANEGNANATYNGVQNYISASFAADINNNMLSTPTAFEAYLMEAGKSPYAGTEAATDGGILATKVLLPAMGNVGIGQIAYDKFKDESEGETDWTYLYDVDSTSYAFHSQLIMGTSNAAGTQTTGYRTERALSTATTKPTVYFENTVDGPLISYTSFSITNFVVREVTIRNYNFQEYWEAIGSLWAASLLICVIAFGETDISDKKHRMVRVFNFTLPKYRDAWLEEAEANPDNCVGSRDDRETRDAEFEENWAKKNAQMGREEPI